MTKQFKLNKETAKQLLKKTKQWLENGGKTWVAFGVLSFIIVMVISSVVKIQEPVERPDVQTSNNEVELVNPLAFAGFSTENITLNNSKIIESVSTPTSRTDIIQLEKDSFLLEVQTQLIQIANQNTGFNPAIAETISTKEEIKKVGNVFDYDIAFTRDKARDADNKLAYTMVDISSGNTINEFFVYNIELPIFAEQNKGDDTVNKARITAFIKPEARIQSITNEVTEVLQNIKRIERVQIFSDALPEFDITTELNSDRFKPYQSNKLKYQIKLPEGYRIIENDARLDGLQVIEIANDKGQISITKRGEKGVVIEGGKPNTVKLPKRVTRDAQITGIKSSQYQLSTYGNDGKSTTINLGAKDMLGSEVVVQYRINTNISNQDVIKQIKEFDIIMSSIEANPKPTNANCEQLKGQKIPFNSPLCGVGLEYTQVNQDYSQDHQALDIVANETYYSNNKDFARDNKEYFYAVCDGNITNYQDKATLANVIRLECEEKGYIVEYWHDKESFWDYSGKVKAGDALGVVGDTGSADGRHIHYIIEKDGQRVNPLQFINN